MSNVTVLILSLIGESGKGISHGLKDESGKGILRGLITLSLTTELWLEAYSSKASALKYIFELSTKSV